MHRQRRKRGIESCHREKYATYIDRGSGNDDYQSSSHRLSTFCMRKKVIARYSPFSSCSGSVTSVGEERANLSAIGLLVLRGLSQKVVDFLYNKKTTRSIAIKFYL